MLAPSTTVTAKALFHVATAQSSTAITTKQRYHICLSTIPASVPGATDQAKCQSRKHIHKPVVSSNPKV
jgi:hypothetical protein